MRTKEFNLEEALNGAKVVTRDGREVTQLTKMNAKNVSKIFGVVDDLMFVWVLQRGRMDRRRKS